jgi:hypothetical protein
VDPALLSPESPLRGEATETLLQNILETTRQEIIQGAHRGVIDLAKTVPGEDALLARRSTLLVPAGKANQVYQKVSQFLQDLSSEYTVESGSDNGLTGYTFMIVLYPQEAGA